MYLNEPQGVGDFRHVGSSELGKNLLVLAVQIPTLRKTRSAGAAVSLLVENSLTSKITSLLGAGARDR